MQELIAYLYNVLKDGKWFVRCKNRGCQKSEHKGYVDITYVKTWDCGYRDNPTMLSIKGKNKGYQIPTEKQKAPKSPSPPSKRDCDPTLIASNPMKSPIMPFWMGKYARNL